MQNFVQMIDPAGEQGGLDEADPQLIAIQQTMPQIAAALKEEFVPYLPTVME